ncbi:MAG: ASKHA domain-containing protein [Syntrophorhabdales bacterium]|jgi:uncharacterized 2Fe-2S/4Fe-4S cluster protein (DUF4445 family)
MPRKTHRIVFAPSSQVVEGTEGKTILDAARETGIYVDAPCGGKGLCGGCRVRVMEGDPGALTEQESGLISPADKALGYRLACMMRIEGAITVLVPGESVLGAGAAEKPFAGRSGAIVPSVKGYALDLSGGDTGQALFERIAGHLAAQYGLKRLSIDVTVLRGLGRARGDHLQGRVTVLVWMEREIIGVLSGSETGRLGLALDIGTTTVAAYVCDLTDGRIIATGSLTNPQVLFGADIMSRISYSSTHPEGVKRMQTDLVGSVTTLLQKMAEDRGFAPADIVDATVVGNTVMHHIALGIPPDCLGLWPFAPAVQRSLDIKARDLGMPLNPASYVHVLPVEAAFVGADNVAVLLSDEPHKREEVSLIIDLGTNGEIVLGNRDRLLSCSCATGPALEGAHISCGMRAIKGAVEKVRIDPATFEVDYAVVGVEDRASGHEGPLARWASVAPASSMPLPVCIQRAFSDRTGPFTRTGA